MKSLPVMEALLILWHNSIIYLGTIAAFKYLSGSESSSSHPQSKLSSTMEITRSQFRAGIKYRRSILMRHTRQEVITRIIQEFESLDRLVNNLSDKDWNKPLARTETKDPWTVKDALAHITHWKADEIRKFRKQPVPLEEKGLNITNGNRLIYERWRDRSPQEVLAWHRRVQEEVLVALQVIPEAWFSDRERRPEWPFDLDGHSRIHRIKDIEQALEKSS